MERILHHTNANRAIRMVAQRTQGPPTRTKWSLFLQGIEMTANERQRFESAAIILASDSAITLARFRPSKMTHLGGHHSLFSVQVEDFRRFLRCSFTAAFRKREGRNFHTINLTGVAKMITVGPLIRFEPKICICNGKGQINRPIPQVPGQSVSVMREFLLKFQRPVSVIGTPPVSGPEIYSSQKKCLSVINLDTTSMSHFSLSKFTEKRGAWFTNRSNHIHIFTPITGIVAT